MLEQAEGLSLEWMSVEWVVYGLGCGSRPITHLIAESWPAATVYGVDNSPDMLAKAATEPGRVQWAEADIHHWRPDNPHDLIYSNATLQWVEGHRALFPCLLRLLNPGGCLAVQMLLS